MSNIDNPTDAAKSMFKILIAEDEDDLREAVVESLLEDNFEVETAVDGNEAVKLFPEFQPDLAVLDMHMPMIHGADVCAFIRETSDIPVIMFTSVSDEDEVKGAIAKGATDFVLKTTGFGELAGRVAIHLGLDRDHDQETTDVQQYIPMVDEEEAIKLHIADAPSSQAKTITLIIDKDPESRAGIKTILKRLSQDFIEVEDGEHAVEAIEQYDPDVMITETVLPDGDAFNMISLLNKRNDAKKLITIAMAEHLSPEAQRKLQFVGVEQFLYKPLDPWKVESMLGDSVNRAMRRNKRREAAKQKAEAVLEAA